MRNPLLTTWRRRPWLAILVAAALADVTVRVAVHFDLALVRPIEAGLLGAASAFVLACSGRGGAVRRGELSLAAVLGLAGLRSLLWGAGVPVWQANLVVLALAIIVASVILRRGRRAVVGMPVGDRQLDAAATPVRAR